MEVRVLGVSASPRRGNSLFFLKEALAGAGDFPWDVRYTEYDLAGKRLLPCTSCHHCRTHDGDCGISDDFAALRQSWVESDVIIYSVPVYHVGVPAQLKAFFDRLGNSLSGYYGVASGRPLKVIGALVQGCHLFGGQELAASTIIHHAVLMGSVPVAGDRPESYIAGAAWTGGDMGRDSLERLCGEHDRDAEISLRAAASVVRRS
ncbi:MAG: flavodoxin family protein, partial [Bacillota bacterium]